MATLSINSAPAPARSRSVDLAVWGPYIGAGLLAGLAGGALARIAMRGVALIEGQTPSFSIFGTLGILVVFMLPGLLVGLGALAMVVTGRMQRRRAFGFLAVILTLLLIGPLYAVATGDLQNAEFGRILSLMALFVPVPIAMAWVAIYGAEPMQRRAARGGDRTIPAGWAVAILLLSGVAFVSAIGALSGAQRHPRLVNTLIGSNSVDFTFAADQMRLIGMLTIVAYLGFVFWALWRRPQEAGVRRGATAALLVPTLLLTAGTGMPPVLSWLPEAGWSTGIVQALGLAALFGLFLMAGGFRPARTLVVACSVLWALITVWLVAGLGAGSTAWVGWGMLALALSMIILVRWQANASRLSTLLLAVFAVLWLGLWAAAMVLPSLRLVGMSPFAVSITVKLFWLPWLLLPAALLASTPAARSESNG